MHPSEALSPRDAFGARVVAYILDLGLVLASIGPLEGSSGLVMALVFSFLYLGVAQGLTGYTLAKALLGARAVKVGTLESPGVVRGILRWIAAPVGIPVLSAAVSLFNDGRRGLGDQVAGTEVVGMGPEPKYRVYAVIAYGALISAFIAFSSFDTFLIVAAIALPMIAAGLVVVLGSRRMRKGTAWLTGLGFTLVAASLMSFQGLCERGAGRCEDTAGAQEAIPALIAAAIAIAILFALRGVAARYAVMALTVFAEVWMFLRLRSGEEMGFAAALLVMFLIAQVFFEITNMLRERHEADSLSARSAATAGPI